jgi:hypothetical protein
MGTEVNEKESLVKQEHAVFVSVDYRKEIEKIKEQKQAMDTLIKDVLKEDVHYGLIPGCGKKPSLLKPGAEMLVKLFRLTPEIITQEELLDAGHIKFISIASLYFNGDKVGQASGSCSTLESKYAKKYGKPNENIADVYNTCRKMSEKRALVAVVLITTGASDKFTQDVEEVIKTDAVDTEPEVKKQDAPPATTKEKTPAEKQKAELWAECQKQGIKINIEDMKTLSITEQMTQMTGALMEARIKKDKAAETKPATTQEADLTLNLKPILVGGLKAVDFVCAEITSFEQKAANRPVVFEVSDGANKAQIQMWKDLTKGIDPTKDISSGLAVKFSGLTMKPYTDKKGQKWNQWTAAGIEILIEQEAK